MLRRHRMALSFAAVGVAITATVWATSAGAGGTHAHAYLRDPSGNTIGRVLLSTRDDGKIAVRVWVQGLPAGFHGFHIHTIGVCDPGNPLGAFVGAGGHFNPAAANHGSHAGDLPVILVNADGTGRGVFVTDRYDIVDLFDADGSAFIVHAGADNFANIPTRYTSSTPVTPGATGPDAMTLLTGDAGGRSACGVIKQN